MTVPITGVALDPDVTAVELRVSRDGRVIRHRAAVSASAPRFSFTVSLPVALTSTDLDLVAVTADGGRHRIHRAVDVVAGDVLLVQGQSNAQAGEQVRSTSSDGDRSRWVRTYGTSNNNNSRLAAAIGGWTYAMGDNIQRVGAIGQWAVRMGQLMSAELRIPIAVVNGARGGRGIAYFARNDSDPTDGSTSYGMLLDRLNRAGLTGPGAVDAMLWYQGEADRDDAAKHVAGFTELVADWRQDYGAKLPVYVDQVRSSPCNEAEPVALRDAQRRLPETIANLRVLSTTGLNGHEGCHFHYLDGYRTLGEHTAAVLLADLYRPDGPPVAPPDPSSAHRLDDQPNQLVVALRSPAANTRRRGRRRRGLPGPGRGRRVRAVAPRPGPGADPGPAGARRRDGGVRQPPGSRPAGDRRPGHGTARLPAGGAGGLISRGGGPRCRCSAVAPPAGPAEDHRR